MGRQAVSALAVLLAVVAVVLLPLAVGTTWLRLQVQDTDRYVAAVTPLADDEAVVAAITDRVGQVAPITTEGPFASATDRGVDEVTASDGFEDIWVLANRSAQQQLIALLEEQPGTDPEVDLGLGSLSDLVGGGLLPPGTAAETAVAIDLVDADDLGRAQSGYQFLDSLWFWPAIVTGILAVLALALPGSRRRVVTVLGVGSLLTLALTAGALLITRDEITTLGAPVRGDLVGAFWDALTGSLWTSMVVIAVVAGVSLVARIGLGIARPQRARYAAG